jgi:hypothetical protein
MKIGSKVLCVDDKNIDNRIPNKPVYFQAYHVRDIVLHVLFPARGKGILLEEVHNPLVGTVLKHEPTFSINRFIEIEDTPDAVTEALTETLAEHGVTMYEIK